VDLLADQDDTPDPIPVATETGRGLLVACLHATGRVPSMPYPGKTSHRRRAESKSVAPQGNKQQVEWLRSADW
jgi:hypothetical protein